MKEFIEKLIERLEAKENEAVLKAPNTNDITNSEYQKRMMKSYGFKESISIVNELTEEYKPKTQADRIRSMSDEELAELFTKLAWNSEVQTTPLKYLDWLQSEAE